MFFFKNLTFNGDRQQTAQVFVFEQCHAIGVAVWHQFKVKKAISAATEHHDALARGIDNVEQTVAHNRFWNILEACAIAAFQFKLADFKSAITARRFGEHNFVEVVVDAHIGALHGRTCTDEFSAKALCEGRIGDPTQAVHVILARAVAAH